MSQPKLLLVLIMLPFIVAYDVPDSSGLYVRGSAGMSRRSYRISGCDSYTDYFKLSQEAHGEIMAKHKGYFGGISGHTLQIKTKRIQSSSEGGSYPSNKYQMFNYFSLYGGKDFGSWAFSAGVLFDDYWNFWLPVAGLRLNITESIYLNTSLNQSMPHISGGLPWAGGVGKKIGSSEIWLGTSVDLMNDYETAFTLKVKQTTPWLDIRSSGFFSFNSLYPFDYGVSLGLDIRTLRF